MTPTATTDRACTCRPDCAALRRRSWTTYAQGHDARAAARMCRGSGMTAFQSAAYLKRRFGSVGAADRAGFTWPG